MTSSRNPNVRLRRVSRVITWLIVIGILVGIGFLWGEDILHFATGQDIMDALLADLANAPRPTATPVIGIASASQQVIQTGSDPLAEAQIGPDGFPVQVRQHVYKYVVQPGDSIFAIADRFSLNPKTIFWANTETLRDNVHLIFVGQELYILPTDGAYHTADGMQSIADIAAMYNVQPGDILYSEFNTLSAYDSSYKPPAGLRIVVPGGSREFITWRAPIITGSETGRSNPEGDYHPGSCRERYSGQGGTGTYINPLLDVPYRVTTGFYPWHPGVDLAADLETPIYAADTGVVVFAGWHRDGFGEMIILDHGIGWTTYYGHLATRFVGCGDQVSQGQYIGQMGMSGNASGIHLHFEIRENDIPKNPYLFIEIRDMRAGS